MKILAKTTRSAELYPISPRVYTFPSRNRRGFAAFYDARTIRHRLFASFSRVLANKNAVISQFSLRSDLGCFFSLGQLRCHVFRRKRANLDPVEKSAYSRWKIAEKLTHLWLTGCRCANCIPAGCTVVPWSIRTEWTASITWHLAGKIAVALYCCYPLRESAFHPIITSPASPKNEFFPH